MLSGGQRLPGAQSVPSSSVGSGVGESFDDFFRSRWDRSVRLAIGLTGERGVAEEIVQEAFFEVSRRWSVIINPGGYLRTAVVNRSRSHLRRVAVRRRHPPEPPPLTVDEPELDEVLHVLAELPERRRAALVLRYYEDLPVTEVARLLRCRPGTVSSLLHRGLADLRKVLDEES
jgi:RNA polymerase sigma factor (sigma-70 family)